jgi:hypothetical protein
LTYGKPLEQAVNRREEQNDGLKAKITYHQRQRHFTAEVAEVAEKTNNRVKDKTIIRRSFVASDLAPDVKDKIA